MATVRDTSTENKINIVTTTENNVNVTQPVTSIVTISALGPQGAQGPQGQPGEIPSTGSFVLTSSFNAFTSSYYVDSGSFSTRIINLENFSSSLDATFATDAELNAATASLSASISYLSSSFKVFSGSYNTGSFTGSFQGDGSQLTGIVSSSYALTASYTLGLDTGSFVTTGSFNAFTSSYNTGSFTGSFTGDGSGLTGISSGSSVFQKSRTPANATSSVIDYDTIFNPSNLTVQSSSIFIIDSTSEYYVLGDLTNEGQIIVDGTLKIGGALYNSGSIIGNGIIT